ncbi:MAG: GC-type dockerin domain-anchored protein [Planctomycetota bacterium]
MNHHATGLALLAAVSFTTVAMADPPGTITFPPIDTKSLDQLVMTADDRYIAVGIPLFDYQTTREGFVVIFDTQTGEQVVRIDPSAPAQMDGFGSALAIADGLLFVTTSRDATLSPPAGSVMVYTLPGGQEVTKLSAPAPTPSDRFGSSIQAVAGYLVIGAGAHEYPGENSGRLYVYKMPGFELLHSITDQNGELDVFPFPVASTDELAIGMRLVLNQQSITTDAWFQVFDLETGDRVVETRPTLNGQPVAAADAALSVGNRYAVVADLDDDRAGNNAGWVYVFDLEALDFVSSFGPPPEFDNLLFGIRMGMQGDFAAVASPYAPTPSPWNEGRVDIVHVPTGRVVRTIEALDGAVADWAALVDFGLGIAFAGRGIAVTSNGGQLGTRLDWIPIPELCPADTNADGDLTPADLNAWLDAFNAAAPACDQNYDGLCRPNDFSAWIKNFNAGC